MRLTTNFGDIDLALDVAKAPKTVENFLNYVRSGHYDGTIFHRVISGFMIKVVASMPKWAEANRGIRPERGRQWAAQRGLHSGDGPDERPAIGDGPVLHQPHRQRLPQLQGEDRAGLGLHRLREGHRGPDTVDQISRVQTGSRGGLENVPAETVLIESATVFA